MRGFFSAAVAAHSLGLWLGPPAAAQATAAASAPGGVSLQWVRLAGTEDCLSGDMLARKVEAKLGREIFPAPGKATMLVEGHVERVSDGYRAQLRMSASDGQALGTRDLSSPQDNCAELSETIAVVLAVMIDPDGATRSLPPPPEPKPEAKPEAVPKALEPETPQRLMAFARLGVGLLPDPAPGFGVAYEVAFKRWGGLRVEGVAYLEQEEQLQGPSDLRARLRIAHAGVAYCPFWQESTHMRLAGCLGAELGAAYSRGVNFGPGNNESTIAPWGSGSASARLAVQLVSALELQLGGSFVVPVARGYQGVDAEGDGQQLFEPAPVAGTFDLGLGARF